jgi:hypothetical protein
MKVNCVRMKLFRLKPVPFINFSTVPDHASFTRKPRVENDCRAAICEPFVLLIRLFTDAHQMAGAGTAEFYVV